MFVRDAPTIWNSLRGLICVYKPADVKVNHVRKLIINTICNELNEMECRTSTSYVAIEGNTSSELSVVVKENLADHLLVAGPRYQFHDVPSSWSNYLGTNSSGVLLLGLRQGTKIAKYVRENKPTRSYRIKGFFGQATETNYKDGKVIERTTYKHIKLPHLEKILWYMQAAHQKKMYELCGVDIQSQTAYELAVKGLIRPADSKIPVIYGIKCVEFNPPDFTIEVQCINEYEMYLKTLIQEIGMKLKSTAHCTGIQCIRHSYFTLDDALLKRQWNLQNIVANMENCRTVIAEHENMLYQKDIALQQ